MALIGEPLFQFWELASSNLKAALVKVAPYLKPLGSTLLGAAGSEKDTSGKKVAAGC